MPFSVVFVLLLKAALKRQRRIERAFRDLDLQQRRHRHCTARRQHSGAATIATAARDVDTVRRKSIHRACRRQAARVDADDLPVDRFGALVIGFRNEDLRSSDRHARFRLGHVGGGDVAGFEPLAGLAQLLFQHFEVAALQLEDRRIAQQVHVSGDGIEQHGLLERAQGLARGKHLALGQAGAIGGLKSVQQGLRNGRADSRAGSCVRFA